MLRWWQVGVCGLLAGLFWAAAMLWVRLVPAAVTGPVSGLGGFVAALPLGLGCVWLTCLLARLRAGQIGAACLIVIGDAMLIDGVALRWFHGLYSPDERTSRLAAAWLLWGYGASAYAALLLAQRRGAPVLGRAAR